MIIKYLFEVLNFLSSSIFFFGHKQSANTQRDICAIVSNYFIHYFSLNENGARVYCDNKELIEFD